MQSIRLWRMSASRLQTRKRSVAWTLEKLLKNFAEIEPLKGIEPLTSSLPRKCSTTELQRLLLSWQIQSAVPSKLHQPQTIHCRLPTVKSGRRGSNSPPIAWKAIALPNELLPLLYFKFCRIDAKDLFSIQNLKYFKEPWAEQGSNLRTRERTDLQSVAFNRSAICPTDGVSTIIRQY